jgi:hypothetical protein
MNGNPGFGSLNWQDLEWGQLFAGIEIGKQWGRENGEYDQLAIDIFHAGTRSTFSPDTTPNKAGGGFKILGEKQWGSIVGFAANTYNTAEGGGISTTFSNNTAVAGCYVRPFGIRGEMAIAGMWTQPQHSSRPWAAGSVGTDAYWNIAVTPNSTLTPDLQLIWRPSFNPKVDFVAIPAIKFRVAL